MTKISHCEHVTMLETLVAAGMCRAVTVDDGTSCAYVPAAAIESETVPRGEIVHLGPVSFLDADVAISQFDEASSTIALMMVDGRTVILTMVRPDSDAILR
jgi:hypothetical protein